jgi:hypothetical protein
VNLYGGRCGHPRGEYKRAMDRDGSVRGVATRRRTGRIVVRGEFGPLLGAALPQCEIAVLSGETHVTALVRDEAELFGIIERLRDLGAALVSVAVDP